MGHGLSPVFDIRVYYSIGQHIRAPGDLAGKKDEFPLVADQGKEALNFQITVLIAAIISALLTLVIIGFLLLPVVGIYWLVFTIIAAIRSNEGQSYRYPYTLRLIK